MSKYKMNSASAPVLNGVITTSTRGVEFPYIVVADQGSTLWSTQIRLYENLQESS